MTNNKLHNWIKTLDRLSEVNLDDLDDNYIKDIEEEFDELNLISEAKSFVLYWSETRKLKRWKFPPNTFGNNQTSTLTTTQ